MCVIPVKPAPLPACSPHSSYDVARRTVLLLREVCSRTRWANARYLHVTVLHVHVSLIQFIVYRDQVEAVAEDLFMQQISLLAYVHVHVYYIAMS